MGWLVNPYSGYIVITNRAGRREFWTFIRFNAMIMLPLYIFSGYGNEEGRGIDWVISQFGTLCTLLLLFYSLSIAIPLLTMTLRRLHDQDKSGWYLLVLLIPYGGFILILSYMLTESTIGPNRFGEDSFDRIYDDNQGDIDYFSTAGHEDPSARNAP